MCLVLYLGSDAELQLVAGQDFSRIDYEDPSWPLRVIPFSVEELKGDAKIVAAHFFTKTVLYAGSFEGCGCGFNACHQNESEEALEPDEQALAGRTSRRLLRDYVEKHGVRQIYGCWSGDEGLQPSSHMEITLDRLVDWTFEIPERIMLKVADTRL